MQDLLNIESYSAPVYKKCGCCGRVRDLYYRMSVKDAATGNMIVGTVELCRECGENFGEIIGTKVSSNALKEFRYGR